MKYIYILILPVCIKQSADTNDRLDKRVFSLLICLKKISMNTVYVVKLKSSKLGYFMEIKDRSA